MSTCDHCACWVIKRVRVYEDKSEFKTFEAPAGKGHCDVLDTQTAALFGCNKFTEATGFDHIVRSQVVGAPWQHFKMGACPNCNGKGCAHDGACSRCIGTGKVRFYDDGYVGEESTRRHPKEPAPPPAPQQTLVPASPASVV